MKISESSTDYEKLAKKIYEEILATDGVDNIDVRHNVNIQGKSGVEHQIDVFWEYKYAGVHHRVLIECKHYSHAVSLLHVRNLHGLLTDIPNSTGIIITTVGFQSGAKKYADFYEIGLKLIRKPQGKDWDGYIQIVNIQMMFIRNHYIDFKIDVDGKDQSTKQVAQKDPSVLSVNPNDITIKDKDCEPCAFNLWLDRHLSSKTEEFGVENTEIIEPESSYIVTPDQRELKLGKIEVKYIRTQTEQNLEIDAMTLVEAVLQDFNSGKVEHMHNKNS